MRSTYRSLPRAPRVHSARRYVVNGRAVALLIGAALLLVQGRPLGNGERAEAGQLDPVAAVAAPAPSGLSPLDLPRRVRTVAVTSTDNLLVPPPGIVACEGPRVGAWLGASPVDSGCGYTDAPPALAAPAQLAPPASEPPVPVPETASAASPATAQAPAALPVDQQPMAPSTVVAATPPISPPATTVAPATPFEAVPPPERTAALAAEPDLRPAEVPVTPTVAEPVTTALPAIRLTGRWYPKTGCSKRGPSGDCLPLVIDQHGAKAGSASCRFVDRKQDGSRFNVTAHCASAGESWTAHVRLVVAGNRMTWSSERGTQDYVR